MATVKKSICGTEYLQCFLGIYRACEQSSIACVLCGIRSCIDEAEAHVIALLLNSRHTSWGHTEAVTEGRASSSSGTLKAHPQWGLPVHAPLTKTREDHVQFLCQKKKSCVTCI